MKDFKLFLRDYKRHYIPILILGAILVLFNKMTNGILFSSRNITNIFFQNSFLLVLAIGMIMVILIGKIDLSVGSQIGFIGAIFSILTIRMNMSVLSGIFLCLIIGAFIGAWQGFCIAYLRVPSFIVTLVHLLIFRWITALLLKGNSEKLDNTFIVITNGFLTGSFLDENKSLEAVVFGLILSLIYVLLEFINFKKKIKNNIEMPPLFMILVKVLLIVSAINIFVIMLSKYKGIPYALVLVAVLIPLYYFAVEKINEAKVVIMSQSAENAVKTRRAHNKLCFWVFVNMGFLSALAGLLFAGRLNAADISAGYGLEVESILVCFIGGASIIRRLGTIRGVIIGVIILGATRNAMSILGLDIIFQDLVFGIVLIMAVVFEIYTKVSIKKLHSQSQNSEFEILGNDENHSC